MLLYYLFWMFIGFIKHFYIIFRTNLLTQSPVPVSVFSLVSVFRKKEYQTESKRKETFGRVIFGTEAIQETWSTHQGINEEITRQGGRAHPPGAPSTLVAPLTDFFCLYISIYPKNFREQNRSGVPLPQSSVATKNQSGPYSGTLPEGGNPHRWPSSSSRRSPWRGGSSSPSGLRVCTNSYVFDLSLSLVFLRWYDLDVSRALLL